MSMKSMRNWSLCAFLFFVCLSFFLTGCGGGRDPEDRAYIITMGVDQTEEGLQFFFAPAKTTENGGEVFSITADTLTGVVAQADSRSSREVYLGQLKTVVFGRALLEDAEKFAAVLEELERGMMVSEKVMVLGTSQTAADCVEAIAQADSSTGLFLWEFYKNTATEVGATRGVDLDMLLTEFSEQKGSAILPRMESKEGALSLSGGIALAEGAYAFALSDFQEQAHLLLLGEGKGAVLEGEWDTQTLPFEVRKNKVRYTFSQKSDGRVLCDVHLDVSGMLTASAGLPLMEEQTRESLENFFADIIKRNLENTITIVQQATTGDVFGIYARLCRQSPQLAEQTKDWRDLDIQVSCDVTLQDTGRIR